MNQRKPKNYTRRKRQRTPWASIVLVVGGLLLVLGTIFAFNKPSAPKAKVEVKGSPSLKVDQEIVDLGDIKLGKMVQVSFQLTNIGDQTLRFSEAPTIEVKEGC